MTFTRPSPRAEQLLLWAFVGLAVIARFIHLDSDPKFEYWIFYVEDEGRWIETARNLALFGELSAQGNTLIVVTHEEEIARHACRILRIRDGNIASDERSPRRDSGLAPAGGGGRP